METQPLVVLLGNSLLTDGVAASLTETQMFRLIRIDGETEDVEDKLQFLEPDLILFELDCPNARAIISLLKDRSDLLLVGLDMDCSRAIVLNSRQHLTGSMDDLQQVVHAAAGLRVRPSKRVKILDTHDQVNA